MQTINPDAELRYAMSEGGIEPKCAGLSWHFVDYVKPPTRLEAELMCSGCPLLDLCSKAAQKRRPAWGVWGGRVYGVARRS